MGENSWVKPKFWGRPSMSFATVSFKNTSKTINQSWGCWFESSSSTTWWCFTKKWWHKFGRSFGTLWFRHIHVGSQEIGEAGSWIEAQLLSMTHIRMILIKALAAGLYRNPNLMYPLQSNTNYQKIPKILLEDIPIEMSISFGDFPVIFRVLWRWRYQRSETKASPSFLCRFWMFFDLKL